MITQIKKIRLRRLNFDITPTSISGFTFIEVLAVVVIVGIITLVSFLAFQGKRDETKKTAAYQEMKQMADAEKEVEAYYGVFVPLAVLNDTPGFPADYPGTVNPDCIGNYSYNYYLIDPESGYSGNDGANYPSAITQINDLFPDNDKARKWKGPFVTFQRITTQNPVDPRPVDPWGNDYVLFTWRYGIRYDGAQAGFSSSSVDRYAIVSPGKNRLLEITSGSPGDDVVYTFR
jgi:prepilin-type N-terminal cleavage/methylation domain-containing protein